MCNIRLTCMHALSFLHQTCAALTAMQMDAAGAHMRASLQELLNANIGRAAEAGVAALKAKYRIG